MLVSLCLWGCAASPPAISAAPSPSASAAPTTMSNPSTPNLDSARFPGQYLPVTAQVQLGDALIDLEVTRTLQEQALGLMYRPSLGDNQGMLFQFNPARPVNFWMKNVVISLDMLFVRDGIIQAIAANVPPCSLDPCPTYSPGTDVDSVIELRGGRAAELGLEPGDEAIVQFLDTPDPTP